MISPLDVYYEIMVSRISPQVPNTLGSTMSLRLELWTGLPLFTELPILRLLERFPKNASIRKECTEVCTDAKQYGCQHSGIRSRKGERRGAVCRTVVPKEVGRDRCRTSVGAY